MAPRRLFPERIPGGSDSPFIAHGKQAGGSVRSTLHESARVPARHALVRRLMRGHRKTDRGRAWRHPLPHLPLPGFRFSKRGQPFRPFWKLRLPELAQFSMNPTLESVRVSDSQEKYSTHGAALVFLNRDGW